MSMEEVADSVRRIIKRWCWVESPLVANASEGDTTIKVRSTRRFAVGDEIMIFDVSEDEGEIDQTIEAIGTDAQTLTLSSPLSSDWNTSTIPVVRKLFHHQYLEGVYLGDPAVIPKLPAVTVNPVSRQSEWITIDSTKETYNLQIGVFVEDTIQDDATRFLYTMVDTIQNALKSHIYPLVSPYNTTSLTEDIDTGDTTIRVSDATIFNRTDLYRILIEDPWDTEELIVVEVVDANTVRLNKPVCTPFRVADGTIVISTQRFIYNSWPQNIDYGKVFRGSLMKAATIDWFAWEEEIHDDPPRTPSIL